MKWRMALRMELQVSLQLRRMDWVFPVVNPMRMADAVHMGSLGLLLDMAPFEAAVPTP
jgi:hypothetical protein